jgi:hypothetical protein
MGGTFRKTQAGVEELERRQLGLRPELRRLLILIDGKRSTSSIVGLFRPGELENLLDELQSFGMIEATVTSTSFLPTSMQDATDRSPLTDAQFRAAVVAAKNAAKELLGRDAKEFLAKFDACKDSKQLRLAISEIQLRLMSVLGEDAATIFVVAVRDAARLAK